MKDPFERVKMGKRTEGFFLREKLLEEPKF